MTYRLCVLTVVEVMNQKIGRLIVILLVSIWLGGCEQPPTSVPTPTASAAPQPTASPTIQITVSPTYTPTFETADCQFTYTAAVEIRCGYLIVPEDRANPQRMIRLHVAIVSSQSSHPAPDPVVYLNGGPGGYTLAAADYFVGLFGDILTQRDLILFDQRGVGYSEPALDCPEITETQLADIEYDLDLDEEQAHYLAALAACRDRLTAAGINLSAYNSAASAADLHDLHQVLGYETWNLLGISYGTRLALTAMRDFGDDGSIRSVILDSVIPPQVDMLAVSGGNLDHALDLLFTRCAADAACNRAYPDLETRFYALVDKLNNEPTLVTATDRTARTTRRISFNGDDLINTLFIMMYNPGQISTLPRLITRLEQNGKSELAGWLSGWLQQAYFSSIGMTYSVQCVEEIPFDSVADFEAGQVGLPPQVARYAEVAADSNMANCRVWQVDAADPVENEPVISDIPTLVLTGDYDPITPPLLAQEAAQYLSHSYYFEFVGQSHNVVGSSSCGIELVTAFLNQPDMAPDDSCLERLYFGFVTQ